TTTTTTPPTTTTTTTRRTTTRRTTTRRPPCRPKPWWPNRPCGPGGRPCLGCPPRAQLCVQLLSQLKSLERKIRKCVCGQSLYLLP
ncbi:salivary glue protein Sgs-3, partial [Drosophila mojavensis]